MPSTGLRGDSVGSTMRGMDAEIPRGDDAENTRELAAPSGWVTTSVAARSLDVSPRTVRWHIERGNLEAKAEGQGVRRSWLVSIDSLQALRDSRQHTATSPGGYRAEPEDADIAAGSPGNAIRELADRLVEQASRASEFRTRLELSERAESTLREELQDERERRERAEERAAALEGELRALREPPGSPETATVETEGTSPWPDTSGPQTGAQRLQGGGLRGLRRRILGW